MHGFRDAEEDRAMRAFFEAGNAHTLRTLQSAYAPPASAAPAADPLAPVLVEQLVEAPRETVWTAYATSAGWERFFGVKARIGALPGEPFEIEFAADAPAGERGSEGCVVLSSIPGELHSHTWNAPPSLPRARALRTWVVVELEELAPARTLLRARHLGFAELAAAHPEAAEELAAARAYFARAGAKVHAALAAHHAPPAAGGAQRSR
jgi:uncharacterized protein YndB with AHSA1/START domain